MKKLLVLLIVLFTVIELKAQDEPKVQWQDLRGGFNYTNSFTKPLTSAYHINWTLSGYWTYRQFTFITQYSIPTKRKGMLAPNYFISIEYTLLKRK